MFRLLCGNRRSTTAIESRPRAAPVAISAMRNLGNQLGNGYRGTAANISPAGA
jgi:hypothetical protein